MRKFTVAIIIILSVALWVAAFAGAGTVWMVAIAISLSVALEVMDRQSGQPTWDPQSPPQLIF